MCVLRKGGGANGGTTTPLAQQPLVNIFASKLSSDTSIQNTRTVQQLVDLKS